jgi:hypothetical protein
MIYEYEALSYKVLDIAGFLDFIIYMSNVISWVANINS